MIATEALAEMAQQLLRIEGVDPLAMPRYLELNLRVPLDGGNDIRHAAGTATEQILQRVREVREHERALRPGAVYSYFAGSSHAEGCRPTEPRQVFDGYTSTGRPIFSDFVTMSIERKDPNIDRLLAGEDIVLTRVTMGRVLRTQQLAEFGGNSPVFKILGQVDAGLFKVLGAAGKCAFSFQLLRGTTLEGRIRLRLHAVGAVDPMELADPALMQILSRCQRHLDTEALRLQGQSQQGEVDEEAFVLPLLNELARQLQSRTRHAGRRTQHGLERSEEGQRPTSRAYPDAGEASDDAILWDLDQNTVVVLGGKGRVHVFSPRGKHITSVMMQGSAIERRRHMGRWRLAEPEERGEFRIQVKRLIAAGQDATEEDVLPQVPTKAPVAAVPVPGTPDSATAPAAAREPAPTGPAPDLPEESEKPSSD
jgi:DNA-directed RNA polymerase subunit L